MLLHATGWEFFVRAVGFDGLLEHDCNENQVLDACEVDCDGNGIPDDCESFACCLPDGSCLDQTLAQCTALLGTWHSCATCPYECPQPTGSCCLPDGSCTVTLAAECVSPGVWTMFGVCEPNTCPQPMGSCCLPDGSCTVTLAAECVSPGVWTMFGVCEPNPCACPLMGDFDGSNAIDGLDIQYFVDCVLGGGTNCRCGDFVPNGVVDLDDLPGFIAVLMAP